MGRAGPRPTRSRAPPRRRRRPARPSAGRGVVGGDGRAQHRAVGRPGGTGGRAPAGHGTGPRARCDQPSPSPAGGTGGTRAGRADPARTTRCGGCRRAARRRSRAHEIPARGRRPHHVRSQRRDDHADARRRTVRPPRGAVLRTFGGGHGARRASRCAHRLVGRHWSCPPSPSSGSGRRGSTPTRRWRTTTSSSCS